METHLYTTQGKMLHLGQEAATSPSVQSMEQAWKWIFMMSYCLLMNSITLTLMDQ